MLAAPTLGNLPAEVNIAAGAPLHLVLGGHDADGDALTYTVTSSNPLLTASIPKQEAPAGNRSMRITVAGHGEMVFELFEGRAPNTTARIIEIAESGWYDNRIFHRVIDGFMIQGGSRDGQGINGTGQKFDDEYHVELQFTSPGLLAMAKSGNDTNDSQFFITDVPSGGFSLPRWLDFNHTIFGMITAGDQVREAVSQVAVDASDRPIQPVVIQSVEVFRDTQNAVMMIGAPHGAYTSGDVTVTVSDGRGGTATKTIRVNVLPDNFNSNPFLGPIDPIWLQIDTPYSFHLPAIDVEGDPIHYAAQLLTATDNLEVTVAGDGLVTIVPKNGAVGVAEVMFRVGPTAASLVPNALGQYDESKIDSQLVMIHIPPATPTIAFPPGMDSGVIDGSTNRDNSESRSLHFNVRGLTATASLVAYLNGVQVPLQEITRIPQGDGSANYVATIRLSPGTTFADGDYILQVQQILPLGASYGGQSLASDLSAPFSFNIDTVAPQITSAPVTLATQGQPYYYDVQSSEEGRPNVYYEIQIPVPQGMVQNPTTGVITWTPVATDLHDHPIVVLVRDGAGNVGRQEFTLSVFAALEIDIAGETMVDELQTLTLLVTAADPAQPDAPIAIALRAGSLPAGAEYAIEPVDDRTVRFTWQTTEADGPGQYDLVFEADDGARARSYETVRITVREVNTPPEFTQVFDEWTGEEDSLIDFRFLAVDHDLPANELVFSLFGDVPAGAEIDPSTGRFTWIPDETQGGREYRFGVRVTDSGPGSLSAEHTLVIAVLENDKPPVFEPTPAQRAAQGETLEFRVAAFDPDIPSVPIQYSLEGEVPEGLELDAATGRIRWQIPGGYLPDDVLEQTLELTVVATEIRPDSSPGLRSQQIVEITVVDDMAELIAATLSVQQTWISSPLSAPETAPGAEMTVLSDSTIALQQAAPLDGGGFFGSSFFGTQFGPTGASGGGGPVSSQDPGSDSTGGRDASRPGQETTSLETLLDEMAEEIGEAALDALLAAVADDQAERVPPPPRRFEPVDSVADTHEAPAEQAQVVEARGKEAAAVEAFAAAKRSEP